MIYKKEKYYETEDVCVVKFGKGTVNVVVADDPNEQYVAVLLRSNEYVPVGDIVGEYKGKTSNEFKPEVVLSFNNLESLDVVMEFLLEARAILVAR